MNDNENVYFRCRKEAAKYNDVLNSREGAAELLGLSSSSLAEYELGITKLVPVDKVVLMADLYGCPELMNLYCSETCPIGCRKEKATELWTLEKTTVNLIDMLSDGSLEMFISKLTHIAIDGKVDEDEQQTMSEIVAYMSKVRVLIEELELFEDKRKGRNYADRR